MNEVPGDRLILTVDPEFEEKLKIIHEAGHLCSPVLPVVILKTNRQVLRRPVQA
jgi:hypothetical protein